MRLTLRTLLAYLDDVLEPAEAKQIGKKVQASPVATALVSRIREVMRRRRLGAPDLEGPAIGIDPNLVAQYLDNTMPADQVAEIEKICLESDQQLAEVAACHQILTLSLGEPVEITQSNRERLYVLGPVHASEKLQAGSETARNNGVAALKTPVSVATVPGSAGPSFEESLPEYLKAKPWSGKLIPIALAVSLLVWIGVILSDQSLMERLMGLKSVPNQKATSATTNDATEESSAEETPATTVAVADPVSPARDPDVPAPPQVQPGEEPDAPATPEETAAVRPDDEPAEVAVAPQPPEPPEKPEPKDEPANAPQPPAPVAVQYASTEGVLLQRNPKDKSWYVVPRKTDLRPGQMLACPEPFEIVLDFDQGAFRATLLGDTVIELLPPNDTARANLRLISGRMMLHTMRRGEPAWPLGLAIGSKEGLLQFSEVETLCGVEYLRKEPAGFEQSVPLSERHANLYVLSGSVAWTPRGEPARVANKGVFLNLSSDQPPINFGPPAGNTPDWLNPLRRKSGSLLVRFAKQYEKEFELNQPIDADLRALFRAPRPQLSELAVRSLALTDNYQAVVQALAQTEHEDTRKAAINGLRLWLGVRADRGPLLRQALQSFYDREDHIEALYRLLWGISVEEAAKQQPSLELVDWLRSDRVEIRELAFANLVRLTGRKFDYRPLASAPQREPAVKRWYEHVLREGALVKEE